MRYATHQAQLLLRVVLLGALAGCAGDDGVVPLESGRAGLAGAWRGTEFSLTSETDSPVKIDLIVLGGSFTLSITPSGAFTGTAVAPGATYNGQPGFVTIPLSGLVRVVDAGTLRIDFVPEVPPVFRAFSPAFTLDEHTLTFVDPDSRFDFDGDGVDEPATIVGSFSRN